MEELVVLLQGAIETANVERWALEHGENPPPAGLRGLLRTTAYEVTVVDAFHRLSRRHLERHGYVGVWERPLLTGRRGRPKSIDVSLFHDATKKETRLELGLYTKTKLREDAKKLHDERETPGVPGYTIELNLLALWELRPQKTTAQVIDDHMKQFVTDAAAVSTSRFTVEPILASTVDLFAAETGGHRYAVVGLFLVTSVVGDGSDG